MKPNQKHNEQIEAFELLKHLENKRKQYESKQEAKQNSSEPRIYAEILSTNPHKPPTPILTLENASPYFTTKNQYTTQNVIV
jgi:hypothetical protein